jgi:hypothetical protein
MSLREKQLAIGVGLLVILLGGSKGLDAYRTAMEDNEDELQTAQQELSQSRTASKRGLHAQGRLREWGRQSLPTNHDIAKTRYESWLRDQLSRSNLPVISLTSKAPRGQNKRFQQISFVLKTEGTLAQLTEYLHNFYSAGHLHRISETTLQPADDPNLLDISLTIDALSLDVCEREESLSEQVSEQTLPPLEQVRQTIVSRNMFANYQPPSPLATTGNNLANPSEDKVAALAFITSMTQGENGWQMSVRMSDSGKIHYYRVGDSIQIGQFVGQIAELEGRRVIVTIGDQQFLVKLGQNLSQARPITDQEG